MDLQNIGIDKINFIFIKIGNFFTVPLQLRYQNCTHFICVRGHEQLICY